MIFCTRQKTKSLFTGVDYYYFKSYLGFSTRVKEGVLALQHGEHTLLLAMTFTGGLTSLLALRLFLHLLHLFLQIQQLTT
jgi:hypothetical protein